MPLPHNMSYLLSIIAHMFLINPAMLTRYEYSLRRDKNRLFLYFVILIYNYVRPWVQRRVYRKPN
jgi:hypothetical protein